MDSVLIGGIIAGMGGGSEDEKGSEKRLSPPLCACVLAVNLSFRESINMGCVLLYVFLDA